MSTALVLGEPGSGLTTFVGLLYAAQVRLGIDDADEFRFSADRESIRWIGEIYSSLTDGRFPDAGADGEQPPLSFVLGFRRGRLRGLARRAVSEDGEFDTVRLQVGGLLAADIAELERHDAVLDAGTRRLLRSPVVVPLIDATRLAGSGSETDDRPMARYDRVLAGTLTVLGKFLAAEPDRRARRMYPVLVVTKFDRISAAALRRLGAPSGPPDGWTTPERHEVGNRLLTDDLPATRKVLCERGSMAARVDPPSWYFSRLTTEERGGETRIARRPRPPLGGWEPDYPFEEYRSFLLRLGELAHRQPDAVEA
ncbi:MAG: hypothetical protein L3J91_00935 [Thermoplasmata archaeon]|nr:hypothetical protein [Thermoplasmata archaeon]